MYRNKKVVSIAFICVLLFGGIGFYVYKRIELQNDVNGYINEVTGLEVVLENFYNLLESNKGKAEVSKQDVVCIMLLAHRNLEIVHARYVESSLSKNDRAILLLEMHKKRIDKIEKYISPYQTSSEYDEDKCVSKD
jgi:hypothetical protein